MQGSNKTFNSYFSCQALLASNAEPSLGSHVKPLGLYPSATLIDHSRGTTYWNACFIARQLDMMLNLSQLMLRFWASRVVVCLEIHPCFQLLDFLIPLRK